MKFRDLVETTDNKRYRLEAESLEKSISKNEKLLLKAENALRNLHQKIANGVKQSVLTVLQNKRLPEQLQKIIKLKEKIQKDRTNVLFYKEILDRLKD